MTIQIDQLSRLDPRGKEALDEKQLLELDAAIDELFRYKEWTDAQVAAGVNVRTALAEAYKQIVLCVPACPTRTRALNHLIDARQLANAAITFDGVV